MLSSRFRVDVLLAIVASAAVLCAAVVMTVVRDKDGDASPSYEMRVRATENIKAGTVIDDSMIEEIESDADVFDAIFDEEEAIGMVAANDLIEGQALSRSQLLEPSADAGSSD